MLTHEELVERPLMRAGVKAEYDARADEFALLDELQTARRRAG